MAFSGILAVNSGGEKRIKGGGGVSHLESERRIRQGEFSRILDFSLGALLSFGGGALVCKMKMSFTGVLPTMRVRA